MGKKYSAGYKPTIPERQRELPAGSDKVGMVLAMLAAGIAVKIEILLC